MVSRALLTISDFSRDNVKFGRIFGTGRYDYVHHTETSEKSPSLFHHSMSVFKNIGKVNNPSTPMARRF
jgi:hypothetical protein